jgi:hypothetical protein
LSNAKLVNGYIRCFLIGLTRNEVETIADIEKKNYFLKYHDETTVSCTWETLVPEGRIGPILHWMAQTLTECFEGDVRCEKEMQRALIQTIVASHQYLVSSRSQKYEEIVSALRQSLTKMARKGMSKDGAMAMNLLNINMNTLEIIDPPRFKELVNKLVDYSMKPDAELPVAFKRHT